MVIVSDAERAGSLGAVETDRPTVEMLIALEWVNRRLAQFESLAAAEVERGYFRGRVDGLNDLYRRSYGKNGPFIRTLPALLAYARREAISAQLRAEQRAREAGESGDRSGVDYLLGVVDGVSDFVRKRDGALVAFDPDFTRGPLLG